MSREYTFDPTLQIITKEDVDNVAKNLIRAEKIVVGPDFDSRDYDLIFGAKIGRIYPKGDIYGIVILYAYNIVPTRIVLKRRNTLKNAINATYGLNSALRDVRNKQDLIKNVISMKSILVTLNSAMIQKKQWNTFST